MDPIIVSLANNLPKGGHFKYAGFYKMPPSRTNAREDSELGLAVDN